MSSLGVNMDGSQARELPGIRDRRTERIGEQAKELNKQMPAPALALAHDHGFQALIEEVMCHNCGTERASSVWIKCEKGVRKGRWREVWPFECGFRTRHCGHCGGLTFNPFTRSVGIVTARPGQTCESRHEYL